MDDIFVEVGKDRVTVALRIGGCDPDDITRVTGLTPTLVGRIGDPRYDEDGQVIRYRTDHLWDMDSPSFPSGDLEQQLDSLFDVLLPRIPAIKQLPDQAYISVYCGITAYTERPAIFFETRHIQALAALGAVLDIDVYDYSGLDEEDADVEQ